MGIWHGFVVVLKELVVDKSSRHLGCHWVGRWRLGITFIHGVPEQGGEASVTIIAGQLSQLGSSSFEKAVFPRNL